MFERSLGLATATLLVASLLPAAGNAQPMGAKGEDFLYQVEPGDTLEQLALRYTLKASNWATLQTFNHIDDPYHLQVGNILKIPLSLIPTLPSGATVAYASGDASVDGHPMQSGMVLHAGQTLHTDGQSAVTLILSDGSQLTLDPGTTLQVLRLKKFQGTGLTDTVLEMKSGSLDSSVAPDHQGVGRFEVRTPVTVTGVRGTQLRIRTGDQGSQHEVLQGRIATQGTHRAGEQDVTADHGIAYGTSGQSLGIQKLLPAPTLQTPVSTGGGWRLTFEPIPGAAAYRVRVAQDAAGRFPESEQTVTSPVAMVTSRLGGRHYVFIRGISPLKIEGQEASLALEFPWGVTSSDGSPVLDGFGEPIRRQADW